MKKIIVGVLAAMLVLIVGVYAYNSGPYRYSFMHNNVEKVLDSGTYEDLQVLREEYSMPVMYWIENEQDFEQAQAYHEQLEQTPNVRLGGCHGW